MVTKFVSRARLCAGEDAPPAQLQLQKLQLTMPWVSVALFAWLIFPVHAQALACGPESAVLPTGLIKFIIKPEV